MLNHLLPFIFFSVPAFNIALIYILVLCLSVVCSWSPFCTPVTPSEIVSIQQETGHLKLEVDFLAVGKLLLASSSHRAAILIVACCSFLNSVWAFFYLRSMLFRSSFSFLRLFYLISHFRNTQLSGLYGRIPRRCRDTPSLINRSPGWQDINTIINKKDSKIEMYLHNTTGKQINSMILCSMQNKSSSPFHSLGYVLSAFLNLGHFSASYNASYKKRVLYVQRSSNFGRNHKKKIHFWSPIALHSSDFWSTSSRCLKNLWHSKRPSCNVYLVFLHFPNKNGGMFFVELVAAKPTPFSLFWRCS